MKQRLILSLQGLVLVVLSLWIYAPALHGSWVWDDGNEIVRNAPIHGPLSAFGQIWWAPKGADYFPLKESFQWIEWHLWGDSTFGYHLASVGLHVLSALLFWRILNRLGVRFAGLGALLFAVHPQMVESVAWVAELKNTLSLPLLLASFLAYLDFEDGGRSRRWAYALALVWFVAAALAKSSVVMYPVALLLLTYWRNGRIRWRDVGLSVPFFAVSLALGLVTVWFQQHRAIGSQVVIAGTLTSRLGVAGWSFWFYLGKFLLPLNLTPVYPLWQVALFSVAGLLPWVAAAVLAGALAIARGPLGRALALGLGWYALNLLPVLGVIPMAFARLGSASDHFAYLSLLGLAGLVAAGAGRLAQAGRTFAMIAAGIAGAIILALSGLSHSLAANYRDDEAFWTYAADHNPDSWIASSNLGLILMNSGRIPEAVTRYERARGAGEGIAEYHNNLGNAYAGLGRFPDAIAQYRAALALQPRFLDAVTNLGNALAQSGNFAGAAEAYGSALAIQPGIAQTHSYLGYTLTQIGHSSEAMTQFDEAIRLDPSLAEPHYRKGNLEANSGRMVEAIDQYQEAIRLKPDYAEAYSTLGLAYAVMRQPALAIEPLQRAIALQPKSVDAHAYLAFALNALGRYPGAIGEYRAAIQLGGMDPDLHYNLAMALRSAGQSQEAASEMAEYERLRSHR